MAKKVHFTVRTKQIEEELMAKYGVKSPKELPVDPGGLQELEEQRINNGIYNRAFESIYATYEKHDLLYQFGGVAAPMLAVQSLSMGLAGNDTRAHAHYDQAARAYRNYMLTVLNEDTAYRLSPGSSAEESLRGRELWEKVPPFVYRPPDAGWVLRHYGPALAALAAWLALTVFAARYVFARRSV
jgi:ABC-2 type transport system permease protein